MHWHCKKTRREINFAIGIVTTATKIENAGKKVVRFASDSGRTNIVAFDSSRPETRVSLDSLRKAVYVDGANFLYSEVRNYPGTGNPLHQAGWWEAWRHHMLTDWLFSKRKVNGVTVSISAEAAAAKYRPMAPEGVRVVFRDGIPAATLIAGRTSFLDVFDEATRNALQGRLTRPYLAGHHADASVTG